MIRVLDTEATGLEATEQVIEIAAVDVISGDPTPHVVGSALVKPTKKIPPEASAIHHILDEDVALSPSWASVWPRFLDHPAPARQIDVTPVPLHIMTGGPRTITAFAAHVAAYDGQFITDEMRLGRPLICTYKAALRVWPQAPNHKNMTLRYWLKLPVPREQAAISHRAPADALVTAYLLVELFKHATLDQMIEWTAEPALLPTCPIGDFRGKPWSEVDISFLNWMLSKASMEDDLKWNARREIDRRKIDGEVPRRVAYVGIAKQAAATALTVQSLQEWFRGESENRQSHKILKGTIEFDDIAAACAARKSELLKAAGIPTTERKHDTENKDLFAG